MKTVVFSSPLEAARSNVAAAFFNSFTLPSLVRAVPAGLRHRLHLEPEIVQVLNEVGLQPDGRAQALPDDALASAALIVTFTDSPTWAAPSGVPRECWDVADPTGMPLQRIREIRDRLRARVWKLVAKQGWYKLQPARIAFGRGEELT